MNYKALYRTYRPANFSEVEGQEHIVRTLTNLIKSRKISHAYLFSGPRGTGKTSVAKIFANVINCGHSVDLEIACQYCIMTINNSVDVIEIDAASNNGINEIRELREKVKFAPTKFPYKIYIIDEVHMLTKGAFNALLKTLEEPPKHVIFILATTDPDKLPLTILSRVQRYNFKRISREIIEKQVNFVFEKENIKAEKGVIEIIALLANGSLRDALSIIDQINAYSNSNIKINDVNDIFGLTSKENQVLLINYCSGNFVGLALKLFDELINQGIDIHRLINSLIRLLKNYLLYSKTQDESIIEEFDIETLNMINLEEIYIYEIIDILINLINEVKHSDIPQQLFQIAIIKMCSLSNTSFNNNIINVVKKSTEDILENEEETITESISKKSKYEEDDIKEVTDHFIINKSEEIEVMPNIKEELLKNNENTKMEEFKENSFIGEKILEDITDILTLSNESNIDVDVVEGSILGDTNTENIIYDTNEFLTNNVFEEESKTKLFDASSITSENNQSSFSFNNNFDEKTIQETKIEPIILTQPDIINLFLLGDKTNVAETRKKLDEALLSSDDKYLEIISYLEGFKIITSSKEFVLISSSNNNSIDYLVENIPTPIFKEFIFKNLGGPRHFFAITKSNFLDSAELYKELKANDRLPNINPLPTLSWIETPPVVPKEIFEAEKKGKDIFGKIFKIRK